MSTEEMTFVLSMHRSGTQSADLLLKNLGFKAIHNPSGMSKMDFQDEWLGHEEDLDFIFDNIMQHIHGQYNAISDNPMAALYEQAFKKYPDAKFILTLRDPDKWIASIREHIGDRELVPAEKVQYWKYLDSKPTKITQVSDEALKAAYLRHSKEIIDFFKSHNAQDQLCVVKLVMGNEEIGKIITTFLNCDYQPLPRIDSIHGNKWRNSITDSRDKQNDTNPLPAQN
jgi:hypothetical protein